MNIREVCQLEAGGLQSGVEMASLRRNGGTAMPHRLTKPLPQSSRLCGVSRDNLAIWLVLSHLQRQGVVDKTN